MHFTLQYLIRQNRTRIHCNHSFRQLHPKRVKIIQLLFLGKIYDSQIDKRLNRRKSKVQILLVNVDYQALISLTLCPLVPGRKYKLLSKKR